MSTNLEYREREKQRKRESGRQASEAQGKKKGDREPEREIKTKESFFVGRTTRTFCSGGENEKC